VSARVIVLAGAGDRTLCPSTELERQTDALARLGPAGVALAKAAARTIADLEYGKSLGGLRG
jgi:hypothetical protein